MSVRLWRRLAEDLSGRSYRAILEQVEAHLRICQEGVALARRAAEGGLELSQARRDMARIEHLGDVERVGVAEDLSRALTTPMDREDIQRLSRAIDDVLDDLRDYVRETHLYDVRRHIEADPLLDAIGLGLRRLEDAVREVRDHGDDAVRHAVAARTLGNRVRRLYLDEMAALFTGDIDMPMLKRRELLRRLDLAGRGLADAADALNNGLIKRSH